MKQLTCEMCGSTDLIKQDGVFVCQTCGCKYSVEEAKKMMIEGTVDVRGTVQVDNSALVKKYLENARRAKEKEDWEETEKYYNMVEQNDPDNIEAIFYSAYGKAQSSLVDSDIYKRQAVFKVLNNCVSIIDDKYKVEDKEQNEIAIKAMAADLLKMFSSSFVFTEWKNGYGNVTRTNKSETYKLFIDLIDAFHESILNIEAKDPELYMYETFIEFVKTCKNITFEGYDKNKFNVIFDKWIVEQKEERVKANWGKHENEKTQFDKEKSALNNQISALYNEIDSLDVVKYVKELEEQIASLKKQRDGLGIFKGKEGKVLLDKIERLSRKLFSAKDSRDEAVAPIQSEIDNLQKRINEINDEMEKILRS